MHLERNGRFGKLLIFLVLLTIGSYKGCWADWMPDPLNSTCKESQVAQVFDERCCGTQAYTMGHVPALLKHFNSCNVPPWNKSLSLIDSQWTFYKCLVDKSLGKADELSPETYTMMMAADMEDGKRTELISLVKSKFKDSGIPSDQVGFVKRLWGNYFEAESKVCKVLPDAEGKVRLRQVEPSGECKEGTMPHILMLPTTVRKMFDVGAGLKKTFGAENSTESALFKFAAIFVASGVKSEAELATTPLDLETLYKLALPKYLSQAAEERLLTGLKDRASKTLSFGGDAKQVIWKELEKKILEMHKEELETAPQKAKVFYTNGVLIKEMFELAAFALAAICGGMDKL